MYEKWLNIEFPKGKERFARYSKEEIGKAVKTARVEDKRSRKEVAEILGISENTLKCYEEGRRTIPATVYLVLVEIYGYNKT